MSITSNRCEVRGTRYETLGLKLKVPSYGCNDVKVAERSRSVRHRVLLTWFEKLTHFLLPTVYFLLSTILVACDFQGPWSYYPEETEVYQGIYTFGYIVADESPYVCFSKVYGLTESSAESFAFYDSAHVTVSGLFGGAVASEIGEENSNSDDSLIVLKAMDGKPNCFVYDRRCYWRGDRTFCSREAKVGIPGESYTLNAVFKWDSAGHKVTTEMKAVARIPTKIHAKGVVPPSEKNDAKFVENKYDRLSFEFLGYPNDMLTYKIPMEYDETVRGIQMVMEYDSANGGESMNTTMMNMLSAFTEPDSMGYAYMSTKRPEEKTASMGFTTRMMFAGMNTLDTMEYPGMTMPIGKSVIRFYATDQAYSDYKNTVLEAIEDSRVVPKSNVENGMGVFAGMLKDSLLMEVTTDEFVPFEYMGRENCFRAGGMGEHERFETKWCRLNKKNVCTQKDFQGRVMVRKTYPECFAAVESIMIENEYGDVGEWKNYIDKVAQYGDEWWEGLISDRDYALKHKDEINAEALLNYCMEYNFKNNSVASCDALRKECQESLEKTACKDSLWQWCSDRDWNIVEYSQCGTALVSRYYLEKLESPILKRVVDLWCEEHPKDLQCKR